MINIPIVDDRLDLRIAGEWTKRQGYTFNEITDARIDGRDLWSGRVTHRLQADSKMCKTNLVWEHFSEDDDRMRTAKQICKTAPISDRRRWRSGAATMADVFHDPADYLSQGCSRRRFIRPMRSRFRTDFRLPITLGDIRVASGVFEGLRSLCKHDTIAEFARHRIVDQPDLQGKERYSGIECRLYDHARADLHVADRVTTTISCGRPKTTIASTPRPARSYYASSADGLHQLVINLGAARSCCRRTQWRPTLQDARRQYFCDPQLGCSDRLVAQDLSDEHAWQLSQEFRLVVEFQRSAQFQRRRQLSPLRNRRKLLRLHQFADTILGHADQRLRN